LYKLNGPAVGFQVKQATGARHGRVRHPDSQALPNRSAVRDPAFRRDKTQDFSAPIRRMAAHPSVRYSGVEWQHSALSYRQDH
jgi:hypothetical protein